MAQYRAYSILVALAIVSCACGYQYTDQGIVTKFPRYCEILSTRIDWGQADLRLLDPPDAPLPTQDVIAAYTRIINLGECLPLGNFPDLGSDQEVQVRLDFLDLTIQNHSDIYLAFDHRPGGITDGPWGHETQIAWDTVVLLPATGQIQAWDNHNQEVKSLSTRVIRNPILDTLEIRLDTRGLPGSNKGYRVQVITTPPGEARIADQLPPFSSNETTQKPAQVLFAFWNTLPAYTPAQALRRWDGAHTGPLGGRHGLYNLLRTARGHKIPLVLLDLKSPISLSALDYVDGVLFVQKMADEGLLILPETVPFLPGISVTAPTISADSLTQLSNLNRQISLDFGLTASQFIYSPMTPGLPNQYPVLFTNLPLQTNALDSPSGIIRPLRWREKLVIPIPESLIPGQASLDGIALETRKALVWAALSANNPMRSDRQSILILGGDLPQSEWGVPQIARAGFRYLAAHPWIRLLGTHDLLTAQPAKNLPSIQIASPRERAGMSTSDESYIPQILDRIRRLQSSPLSQASWQALISLYGPLFPQPRELSSLRAIYATQLEVLIAAAEWSMHPSPISSCKIDLDLDGQMECLLASDEIFAVFNSENGTLTYLFVKSSSGFHQVIAPSSQFAVGLSEHSGWLLDKGLGADPAVLPGAFSDDPVRFHARQDLTRLSFISQEITKSFYPITGGIRIEYSTSHPISTRLPLALDPWERFTPAWGERYSWNAAPDGGTWNLATGSSIEIRTNAQINVSQFGETRTMMVSTENPNAEYSPGHFLPFPLAMINLQAPSGFFVELFLSEP